MINKKLNIINNKITSIKFCKYFKCANIYPSENKTIVKVWRLSRLLCVHPDEGQVFPQRFQQEVEVQFHITTEIEKVIYKNRLLIKKKLALKHNSLSPRGFHKYSSYLHNFEQHRDSEQALVEVAATQPLGGTR